jgi:ABC-type Fe3+-hydroxamate transport system substrate-binding protein
MERPRIVSLVPSLTELVCDLGLGDCLVGRTAFCVHPAPALAKVPRVGGTKTPKLERILALEPSHVLVNVDENRREDAEWLAARVPVLVVTHPVEIEDHLQLFARLAALWGRHNEADRLAAELIESLDRLSARSYDPLSVFYLIWSDPWMTVGRETFIARMLARVGLMNLPVCGTQARYPVVAPELLSQAHVAAVFLSSEPCRFRAADRRALRELVVPPGRVGPAPLVLGIDGEMCSWYGSRVIRALDYLRGYRTRLEARIARRVMIWGRDVAS